MIKCLLILLFCNYGYSKNIDKIVKEHPLVGKTVYTPDFTLVISNINNRYTLSTTVHKINASLITISDRLSTASFPVGGMRTKKILPPNKKLKVQAIYKSHPKGLRAAFASSTDVAILIDDNNNKYTIEPIIGDRISFQINDCTNRECQNWKRPLISFMKLKDKKMKLKLTYKIKNRSGTIKPSTKVSKPELKKSQQKLLAYLKKKNIKIIEVSENYPTVNVEISEQHYGDLLLNYEELQIKSVSF